jgi:hypothetical protein
MSEFLWPNERSPAPRYAALGGRNDESPLPGGNRGLVRDMRGSIVCPRVHLSSTTQRSSRWRVAEQSRVLRNRRSEVRILSGTLRLSEDHEHLQASSNSRIPRPRQRPVSGRRFGRRARSAMIAITMSSGAPGDFPAWIRTVSSVRLDRPSGAKSCCDPSVLSQLVRPDRELRGKDRNPELHRRPLRLDI